MFSSEGAEGFRRLRRGDQGIRLQPRHLRPARPDERHLGAAAARAERDAGDRTRSRAVAAGQAAAGRRLALRAGMQVAADRAASTTSTAARSNATWCSARSIGVYIDDRFIKNGRLDTAAMRPIARCGYDEYAVVENGVQNDAAEGRRLSPKRRCTAAFASRRSGTLFTITARLPCIAAGPARSSRRRRTHLVFEGQGRGRNGDRGAEATSETPERDRRAPDHRARARRRRRARLCPYRRDPHAARPRHRARHHRRHLDRRRGRRLPCRGPARRRSRNGRAA